MFKSVRWRSEKNKMKAVFKLQFHAIQVPQLGGDGLVVSVVPADVGKPTVKLKKATIRDGSCHWDDPVYETVKFVQHSNSGKIHEKIYRFVVGSSKAGFVGEASIDMSSYASATKTSSVSLPLNNSKSDILLQVSIQRMSELVDHRVAEVSETAKLNSQSKSLHIHMSNGDMERSTKITPVQDTQLSENINPSTKMNGNQRKASMPDVVMSNSDSSSGIDTPQALQMKNVSTQPDSNSFFSSMTHGMVLQQPVSDASAASCDKQQKSWERGGGLELESTTDDSFGSPTEDSLSGSSQMEGDIVIGKLKGDVTALSRQAETSDLELQALRKQVVKENRRGNDLAREIDKLKEERDILKEKCEKLKSFPCRLNEATARNKVHFGGGDREALLADLLQELEYEKDLNNNLRIQLQKTNESNSELLLAVRDLDEMLEQKNKEIATFSNQSATLHSPEIVPDENFERETDTADYEEQKALEKVVVEQTDAKDVYMLEQKILELQNEMEMSRREKTEIEGHMEQLALEYEILKQKNHDMAYKLEQSELVEQLKYECSSSYGNLNELQTQIESLGRELNQKSQDFSDSLNTIGELEIQVKDLENRLEKQSQEHSDSRNVIRELENEIMNLEEELENQAQGFEADLETLSRAKVDQEKRAIQAEESVRKMKWQNSSTAGRLQEELRKLSVQVVSAFEANESLAAKALAEANQLRLQKSHLEEKLNMASESLQLVREQYEAKVNELASHVVSMSNQVQELELKVDEKSKQLDHEARHAEETHKHLTQEISMLKAHLETLSTENKSLAKQTEDRESLMSKLDHMTRSFDRAESLLEKAIKENINLETTIALLKESANESLKELHSMMCQKNEKESIAKELELEVDTLKAQCNELRQLLSKNELENEKLRRQVHSLKPGSNGNEDSFNSIKRKPIVINGRVSLSDGAKVASKDKLQPVSRGKNEVETLKEKIKLLEGLVKQKECVLETSSRSFLKKEKELQKKYEELEQRLENFTKNMDISSEQNSNHNPATKVSDEPKQIHCASENLSSTICLMGESVPPIPSMLTNGNNYEERELKLLVREAGKANGLVGQVELLKEKNKQTEVELKEMQERYSEISLRFAEVEGERQQLVMKLRNLKKNPSALKNL